MFETQNVEILINTALQKSLELFSANKHIEAKVVLEQLLVVNPTNAHAMQLLGLIDYKQGNYKKAIDWFDKAIAIDPSHETYNNLALAHAGLGDFMQAIKILEKVIKMAPDNASYHANLGLQYRAIGDLGRAFKYISLANKRKRNDPNIIANVGGVFGEMGILVSAKQAFREAIRLDPNHHSAHIDLAYAHFLCGEFDLGWPHFEHRLDHFEQAKRWQKYYPKSTRWDGKQDLTNKRLFLYCEQGIGDAIHFIRYVPLLPKDAIITIHCPQEIASLFGYYGYGIYDNVLSNPPQHDFNASLMSLPYLLGNPPVPTEPYLFTNKTVDMSAYKDKFKIGIVWAGNPQHPNDEERSCHLEHFKTLEMDGVQLVSLQHDLRPRRYRFSKEDIDLTSGCENMKIKTFPLDTFEHTAAIIKSVDLVISVDTAVLHLAGALGKPAFGLIAKKCDWRWTRKGNTTIWYPTMRLFRKQGNWNSVFEDVKNAVLKLI